MRILDSFTAPLLATALLAAPATLRALPPPPTGAGGTVAADPVPAATGGSPGDAPAPTLSPQQQSPAAAEGATSRSTPADSHGSRQAAIEAAQAARAEKLHAYVPSRGERLAQRVDTLFEGGTVRWHPFFENAYSGGGFTLGLGHVTYVGGYNYIDARASYTIRGYTRAEVEFVAPRLFRRRASLSVLGGWREATQVGFYGLGPASSVDDRANYRFRQPYANALFTLQPTRRILSLRGGVELTQWSQRAGRGASPSVDTRYAPADLAGLGASVTYLHTQGTVGLDWRTSPGYTRRGAFIGATIHDYRDADDRYGFELANYEGVAHLPILREAWVLAFHGRLQTATAKSGQEVPFFMLPSVGGGSSLRGYSSWRFRDRNSLLLQAEWRIIANRYLESAFFVDSGSVARRASDFDVRGLKTDVGFGVRFHGPAATPLRIEVAKSREGLTLVFASSAAF